MPKRRANWNIRSRKDDCLSACISRLLDIDYDQVPFYGKDSAAKNWLARLKTWANKKGYRMQIVFNDEIKAVDLPEKMIGVGRSPSGKPCDHAALVDKNLKVVWDPTYNKRRSIREIGYLLIFEEHNGTGNKML